MKLKITGILMVFMLAGAGLALSEDQAIEPEMFPTATSPQQSSDSNMQWVWGEVTGVDTQGKALVLKYLDYETDQEKEISISVDDATAYENIKSLEEIQPKNNLSVDYVSKDGVNLAKSISLEKTEITPEPEPVIEPETTAPQADAANMENKPDTIDQSSQVNQ